MEQRGIDSDFEEASELVKQMMNQTPLSLENLVGGKNNQTYKVKFADRAIVLKRYFDHPLDNRDRLTQEFSFVSYLQDCGIRSVPEPLTCCAKSRAACYSFIEGEPFRDGMIDEECVKALAKFFANCNSDRLSLSAQRISNATDAHFSMQDLFQSVQQRVLNLQEHIAPPALSSKYLMLLEQLLSLLERYRRWVCKMCSDWGEPVSEVHRFLSPSDFGFHNALRNSKGEIFFIDFEYAGWDDPGRVVCDVFLQPQLPVDERFRECFLNHAFGDSEVIRLVERRSNLLRPLAGIRWCCIILNAFSAIGFARRSYAGAPPSEQVLEEKYAVAFGRASHIQEMLL